MAAFIHYFASPVNKIVIKLIYYFKVYTILNVYIKPVYNSRIDLLNVGKKITYKVDWGSKRIATEKFDIF